MFPLQHKPNFKYDFLLQHFKNFNQSAQQFQKFIIKPQSRHISHIIRIKAYH